MKKLISLLLVFLLFVSLSVSAFAETASLVTDDADILSSSEYDELVELAQEISEKHNMDCAVYILDSVSDYGYNSIEEFSDDVYDNDGYGQGSKHDGILFTLAVGDRDYWITTTGNAIQAFTDYGLSRIKEDFNSSLRNDEWYDACETFLRDCDDYLTQYESGTPIDVSEAQRDGSSAIGGHIVTGIVIGLIAGFFLSALPLISKKKELENAVGSGDAQSYLQAGSFHLTNSQDQYITTNVVRTPIPKSEPPRGGGHGGSSVHMGSSGTSHGGSGGHF